MITKSDAQHLVYLKINEPDGYWPDKPELVILEDVTITKDYGWVFFYQSKAYLETNSISDSLAGNAPYIVNKHSGKISETGTAQPIEKYIEDYERQLSTSV